MDRIRIAKSLVRIAAMLADEEEQKVGSLDELEIGGGFIPWHHDTKMMRCRLPQWSLVYLVNNDSSGISSEDKELADQWVRENRVINVDPIEYTEGFSWHPEFGEAGDTVECYVNFR